MSSRPSPNFSICATLPTNLSTAPVIPLIAAVRFSIAATDSRVPVSTLSTSRAVPFSRFTTTGVIGPCTSRTDSVSVSWMLIVLLAAFLTRFAGLLTDSSSASSSSSSDLTSAAVALLVRFATRPVASVVPSSNSPNEHLAFERRHSAHEDGACLPGIPGAVTHSRSLDAQRLQRSGLHEKRMSKVVIYY